MRSAATSHYNIILCVHISNTHYVSADLFSIESVLFLSLVPIVYYNIVQQHSWFIMLYTMIIIIYDRVGSNKKLIYEDRSTTIPTIRYRLVVIFI